MTSPLVGKSIAPHRLSSVVFPHPLRPTNATISPAFSSSEMSCKATTGAPSLGYTLLALRTSSSAIASGSYGSRLDLAAQRRRALRFSLHSECLANILVTGGAGYIGSHTRYFLEKSGHSVLVADNLS